MGIEIGIVLLVLGLILVTGVVNFDIGFVDDTGLGWIFVIVGALAIVLALVMNKQRSETWHVEKRRERGGEVEHRNRVFEIARAKRRSYRKEKPLRLVISSADSSVFSFDSSGQIRIDPRDRRFSIPFDQQVG